MTRTMIVAVMALAAGLTATTVVSAQAGSVAQPAQLQVAALPEPTVTSEHTQMFSVTQNGNVYSVHQDTATGRLQLCTPQGKREFLR